ncbi:hypothetical protein BDI4_1280013 [Burkholderia diffusa]|nr:hypothetical protein BDI4_1280013 [Burkholderia diffusa]
MDRSMTSVSMVTSSRGIALWARDSASDASRSNSSRADSRNAADLDPRGTSVRGLSATLTICTATFDGRKALAYASACADAVEPSMAISTRWRVDAAWNDEVLALMNVSRCHPAIGHTQFFARAAFTGLTFVKRLSPWRPGPDAITSIYSVNRDGDAICLAYGVARTQAGLSANSASGAFENAKLTLPSASASMLSSRQKRCSRMPTLFTGGRDHEIRYPYHHAGGGHHPRIRIGSAIRQRADPGGSPRPDHAGRAGRLQPCPKGHSLSAIDPAGRGTHSVVRIDAAGRCVGLWACIRGRG